MYTIVNNIISQFKAQTLGDRVRSPGYRVKSVRVGSGHGSKVQTRFHLCFECSTVCREISPGFVLASL